MLFQRKKDDLPQIDTAGKQPVIRSSICTGEKSAGFRNPETGAFEEVMLIRSPQDVEVFRKHYKIEGEIPVVY